MTVKQILEQEIKYSELWLSRTQEESNLQTRSQKKKDSIFESDILDSELRILDWIFYRVCKDQQKNWEGIYNPRRQR